MNIVLQENNVISNIYVITLPNFRHTKTEKKKKEFPSSSSQTKLVLSTTITKLG